MNEKISITVKGESKESGNIEAKYNGFYKVVNNVEYISYKYMDEDLKTEFSNMIKIRKGSIEIVKKGEVTSRLYFVPGETVKCEYTTPFGQIPLKVTTNSANVIRAEGRMRIILDYYIMVGNEKIKSIVDIGIENFKEDDK